MTPIADVEQGHVEGAAAQIEHEDGLVALLVQGVGERGRGRLVDDAQDLEPGDLTGLLGGLALGVVEVGRDGDDRLGDLVAQVGLGVALQLLQDERAHLLGGELLAVGPEAPGRLAHVPLDRAHGAVRVGHRLALGHLADQHLTGLGEGDHLRGRPGPLGVGDHRRLATLEGGDNRVGGPQVDPYGLGHLITSSKLGQVSRAKIGT
jgi:hypothetical protein